MTMAAGEWARTFAHVSQAMLTESFALCKPSASVLSRYNLPHLLEEHVAGALSEPLARGRSAAECARDLQLASRCGARSALMTRAWYGD